MTQYIAAIIVCIAAVETFMLLPLGKALHKLAALTNKILAVLTSKRVSDHWKEKVLLRYSGQMALLTLTLAGIFAVAAAVIYLLTLVTDLLISPQIHTLSFLISLPGLVTATVASTAYYLIRR